MDTENPARHINEIEDIYYMPPRGYEFDLQLDISRVSAAISS